MEYRNAKHISKNRVSCEINSPRFGWIPYTLDPNDKDMRINNAAMLRKMNENGDVADYIPPTQSELDEVAERKARKTRDYLLKTEVDPIAGNTLRWDDLTEYQKDNVKLYRQELLNISEQAGFPHAIEWPFLKQE
jgi:hypothetical protein